MTHRTYLLPLVLALLLLLSLTACGDSSSDDPQSGYETVMDMEFLDGMWSIDGTSRLYFDSEEGFYAYRTGWVPVSALRFLLRLPCNSAAVLPVLAGKSHMRLSPHSSLKFPILSYFSPVVKIFEAHLCRHP